MHMFQNIVLLRHGGRMHLHYGCHVLRSRLLRDLTELLSDYPLGLYRNVIPLSLQRYGHLTASISEGKYEFVGIEPRHARRQHM